MEQEGGKMKGSWVLVSWHWHRLCGLLLGYRGECIPFRHSILGTVQMKASTRHSTQHTEHNGPYPGPVVSSPETSRHPSMFKLTCFSCQRPKKALSLKDHRGDRHAETQGKKKLELHCLNLELERFIFVKRTLSVHASEALTAASVQRAQRAPPPLFTLHGRIERFMVDLLQRCTLSVWVVLPPPTLSQQ